MSVLSAITGGRPARLVSWWLDTLSSVLLPHLHRRRPWRVLILHQNQTFRVFLRERDVSEEIGAFLPGDDVQPLVELLRKKRLSADQVVLRLALDEVVHRELNLPRGARNVVEPVLRNQLERLTPWPAAQVIFDYEIDDGPAQGNQINVRLTATSQKIVDRLLAGVAGLGLQPGIVDCGESADQTTTINLLPQSKTKQVPGTGTIGTVLAGLTIAAVAVAGLGMLLTIGPYRHNQQLAADLTALQQRTQEVRHLAGEIAEFKQKNARVIDRKTTDPAMIIALEALSRLLPDSVWLTELTVKGGEVRMSGKAQNSPALIARLEASPHFANVRFSAPTIRQPGEREETFTITADAVPGTALGVPR